MSLAELVETEFAKRFGGRPLLVRSPGRVNLIGEHTDYNGGYVLPAAIDKAIFFALAPRQDDDCEAVALDMKDEHRFSIRNLSFSLKRWPNYVIGVVDQLARGKHRLKGFNCVFGGDIPIGAGLSSSAALEAGLAFGLNTLFDLHIDGLSLVKLAQRAENDFVGVQCGIMDQYVNMFGKQDSALRIDCRSLEHVSYPINPEIAIVLFDTGVSRALASSEYNRRREECSEGVTILREFYPTVRQLRDATVEMVRNLEGKMGATIYRRCKYVVEENARVLDACKALERSDLNALGRLMHQSHDGLSREYEVSCEELDFLVDLVRNDPLVLGSRMMGGGFGGCTINLVLRNGVQRTVARVQENYEVRFNRKLKAYVMSVSSGTSIIP